MRLETIPVDSPFGVTLQQPFFRAEPAASRLLILLPGRGYTVHHPALSYMSLMAVEQGWDVLAVQYGFQMTGGFDMSQMPLLQTDINRSLAVIDLSAYERHGIVGKSLGTPLAVTLAARLQASALILLTPVPAALQAAMPTRTLALIGSADPFYEPHLVESHGEIQWKVYEGLDHGFLKPGDWAASIAVMGGLIATCADFLQQV